MVGASRRVCTEQLNETSANTLRPGERTENELPIAGSDGEADTRENFKAGATWDVRKPPGLYCCDADADGSDLALVASPAGSRPIRALGGSRKRLDEVHLESMKG